MVCVLLAACGKGRPDAIGERGSAAAGSANAHSASPSAGSSAGSGTSAANGNVAGSSSGSRSPPSPILNGLRIRLEVPSPVKLAPPQRGSQAVSLKLHVDNTTDRPVRIVLIRPEMFRLFTSSLRVWSAGKVVSLQPPGHPHGYLITEDDFALIPAGKTFSYDQTLYLDPKDGLAQPGAFEVEWMLENATTHWPGGVGTLDGVTKPLFGGTTVPDLWTGKLSTRATLTLEP